MCLYALCSVAGLGVCNDDNQRRAGQHGISVAAVQLGPLPSEFASVGSSNHNCVCVRIRCDARMSVNGVQVSAVSRDKINILRL